MNEYSTFTNASRCSLGVINGNILMVCIKSTALLVLEVVVIKLYTNPILSLKGDRGAPGPRGAQGTVGVPGKNVSMLVMFYPVLV